MCHGSAFLHSPNRPWQERGKGRRRCSLCHRLCIAPSVFDLDSGRLLMAAVAPPNVDKTPLSIGQPDPRRREYKTRNIIYIGGKPEISLVRTTVHSTHGASFTPRPLLSFRTRLKYSLPSHRYNTTCRADMRYEHGLAGMHNGRSLL